VAWYEGYSNSKLEGKDKFKEDNRVARDSSRYSQGDTMCVETRFRIACDILRPLRMPLREFAIKVGVNLALHL